MFLKPIKNINDYGRSEVFQALLDAPGHELTRNKLILRFYGRYDVSTLELDRAINMLLKHHIIQWTGKSYMLSSEYMDSDDYKVRLNEQNNSR